MRKQFAAISIGAAILLAATPPAVAPKAAPTKTAQDQTIIASSPIDRGCPRGRDIRSSDLCAQWKAADAAVESAKWSWWQVVLGAIGLVLGTLTMAAAIAAAIYARRAAHEAGRSAKAAVDAHEAYMSSERAIIRVQRAYLYPTQEGSDSASAFQIRLDVQNAGRAPATIASYFWEISEAPIFSNNPRYRLYRTDLVEFASELKSLRELPTDDPGEGVMWLMGFFDYMSLGREHRTHFCFRATYHTANSWTTGGWELLVSGCQNFPADT